MQILAVQPDLTVLFQHTHIDGSTHHFALTPSQMAFGLHVDGSPDRTLLVTPLLTCTDPGCAAAVGGGPLQVQTTIPVQGGRMAQRLHALYRVAVGVSADLYHAAGAINRAAAALGGTPLLHDDGT